MSRRTCTGSCHCGAVRFEADLDLDAGSGRCNCSICTRTRNWGTTVKPGALRVLQGEDALAEYRFGSGSMRHLFCRTCGVRPFGRGHIEALGGEFASIAIHCLDDVYAAGLAAVPIRYFDGRNDDWWSTPAHTGYL